MCGTRKVVPLASWDVSQLFLSRVKSRVAASALLATRSGKTLEWLHMRMRTSIRVSGQGLPVEDARRRPFLQMQRRDSA